VQIALKPASKALGLHGVFKRGKGRKYLIADSAFKRMQVDAPGACWLDADEHHLGLAPRTGGALNCSEWNDGRQALRLGHDASLEQAGAQHSLSPVMPRRRSGDCLTMRRLGSQTRVNSQIFGRKVSVSRKLRNRKLPPDAVGVRRQLPVWGRWQRRGEINGSVLSMIEGISAVTLGTHEMPRAVRFYRALGFEVLYGGDESSFTSFRAGTSYLNLIAQPAERRWSWWGRIIIYVADVDALYDRALAAGYQPATVPRDAEWGERFFHLNDPDGHELSFAQPLLPVSVQ
jgi:catechol 2,3-dioxygenase-like lactoylglutathione lyase family enzyme